MKATKEQIQTEITEKEIELSNLNQEIKKEIDVIENTSKFYGQNRLKSLQNEKKSIERIIKIKKSRLFWV